MIEKFKKIDWWTFGGILVISFLLCNAFIQMHYSSDTFVLFDLGYFQYPFEYFLLDGRLISTIVCWTAGLLKIPYTIYIISMDIIAVIFVSISIYLVYKTILKIIKTNTKLTKALTLASSFVLVLNQFSLEYLLFPESAIMCLGELLCIIASIKIISNTKYKYLKIGIILFFATFCYQGLINIFPILALLFIILKQINSEDTLKHNVIDLITKLLVIVLLCVLAILISIVSIKICSNLLNNNTNRTIQLIDFESVLLRFKTICTYLDMIWINSLDMLPKHINLIVVIATLILLIISKSKKETIFKYLFIIFISLVICIVPMFFFNTGPCGRVNVPICEIWGMSLLFLIVNMNKKNITNWVKKLIYIVILISFILNSIMILRNTSEHIAANKVDENMGLSIKTLLEKYEKETGITVTKFSYVYDSEPQQYAPGIKHIGSLTERKLACSWCVSQAMNYYCDRKFEKVKIPIKVYTEKFTKQDYTCFSEEQVIFDNDTMYLYIY